MKNYQKSVLVISLLAAFPLLAATNEDDTIYVNTFVDEDGENANACSLREAITAASLNRAYGGCKAGKTQNNVTDLIQLEAGEYQLNKPLTPDSLVNILGASTQSYEAKDPITGKYPQKTEIKTTIKGKNGFSLFDTGSGRRALTLSNMKLVGGQAEYGGAIHAGASVSLNNVWIEQSSASKAGGAIYLSGIGSTLNTLNSVMQNNLAPEGAVLAMSCGDNLKFTERNITIQASSIVNNGNANTQSVISLCGEPKTEITASTIAHNNANTSTGSIIRFVANSLPNQNDIPLINSNSTLSLLSNTIVNNTAYSTFLYDSIGFKSLQYNILAYNQGYSCRHLLGAVAPNDTAQISLSVNGLVKSAAQKGYCDLPYANIGDNTTVILDQVPQSAVMTNMQPAASSNNFMPMYFLINPKNNPMVDLKNGNMLYKECSSTDQRGWLRVTDRVLLLDENNQNSCDLGATELVKLAAIDMAGQTNPSQVTTLAEYERVRDFYKNLVNKPDKAEYLNYYKIELAEAEKKLAAFNATKRYRQIYFNIFDSSVPQELEAPQGIQHFSNDLYEVSVETIGTGQNVFANGGQAKDLPTTPDQNLRCEWNNDLKQILMYRTDGNVSQAADFSYCKYTLRLKSDKSIQSTGIVQGTFGNIAPIAQNTEYKFVYGTDQKVKINLTDHFNDNGDGESSLSNYPANKKPYYTFADGLVAPIKFSDIDGNLQIQAQYSRLCPDESQKMCYGGDIYIQPKNNFNVFNYTINYSVFDAEAKESNTASIQLVNTATTTDDSRKGSSGGGGSMGGWSILSLIVLAGIRYSRRRRDV